MPDRRETSRNRIPLAALVACILILPMLTVGQANAQAAKGDSGNVLSPSEAKASLISGLDQITNTGLAALASSPAASLTRSTTPIEVHGPDLDAVEQAIQSVGGQTYGEVPGFFVEAWVPIGALDELNSNSAVTRLDQVTRVAEPTSRSLANNAELANIVDNDLGFDQWHGAGHQGQGQRIGILDLFGTAELEAAIENDRIPPPAGTFCQHSGTRCEIGIEGGGAHGVAVAEISHHVAPEAELFLASVVTTADLAAAIEWFGRQGVTVINRSETSELDGPGDGTGPTASLIDRAVDLDMVWVAAAGNSGGSDTDDGQNWIDEFNDPDGNGFHNFENGEERLPFTCGFLLGMRWDDWGNGVVPTDYDIYIYDTATAAETESQGVDFQETEDDEPLEQINTVCTGTNDVDYFSIYKYADIQPDGVDTIQILGNHTAMAEWENRYSATLPGNTSENPGAVIVGASERPAINELAWYSSRGPTFSGHHGIDVLAPSCLPIPRFFGFCFDGTSASAPVVAGAVAVMRGAGLIENAPGVDEVLPLIATDGGPAGIDPSHGHGFLTIPAPSSVGVNQTNPVCNGRIATIVGTSGNDVIEGTAGDDVIFAGRGDDVVNAFGGNDIICGGFGDDSIVGGTGNDTIFAGPGADVVSGQNGNDTINGGHGHDDLSGNQGNDNLFGFTGRDYVKGGNGNDVVRGGAGRDRVLGGNGSDQVFGGTGIDYCRDAFEHSVSCRLS